jgi:hypothetical protein
MSANAEPACIAANYRVQGTLDDFDHDNDGDLQQSGRFSYAPRLAQIDC